MKTGCNEKLQEFGHKGKQDLCLEFIVDMHSIKTVAL